MSDPSSCAISDLHTRAICDEVGQRLRILLERSQTAPPQKMLDLLLRLQLSELKLPALDLERHSSASTAA
jgi:hypothetical protein